LNNILENIIEIALEATFSGKYENWIPLKPMYVKPYNVRQWRSHVGAAGPRSPNFFLSFMYLKLLKLFIF